jgi:hypothetical protein
VQKLLLNIALLASLLGLVACEKDLEYDVPGATPQLVVNSLFAKDSLLRIEVSVSASPGDGDQIRSLRDARISLQQDNKQVKDLTIDSVYATPFNFTGNPVASVAPIKLYFHTTMSLVGTTGVPYSIYVSYPGMEPVSASTSIPRPVRIRQTAETSNAAITVDGKPLVQKSFQIDDRGNENYYAIEVLASPRGRQTNPEKITFFSGEKVFAENLTVVDGQHSLGAYYRPDHGVYFSNGKFEGRTETMEFYLDPIYVSGDYLVVLRIFTLSREYFEFATSYQRQKANSGNPFAEPTQVFSNIEGGLGIFGGYSISEIEIN